MNKNKLIAAIAFLLVSSFAFGQQAISDNRTLETKIADLLAQMPASDQAYLNTLMLTIAELGEDGLVKMAGMLTPSVKGNDASVRFAVGGFSKFVTGAGQENNRLLCQRAWCRALEATEESEIKAFLIAQIQQVGNAEAVPFIEKYLVSEQLSDPAARALATINTPEAGNALLNALDKAQGTAQIPVVEALGNIGYQPALAKITPLCSSQDINLKKVALYALAKIGSPQSASVLYDAALKSGFTYEPGRATASYLLWINRLVAVNGPLAEKHCIGLIKECTDENQTQTRSAALSILVSTAGERTTPYLFDAFKSNNRQYWMTALSLSQQLKGDKQTQGWIKKAGKMTGQPKADVVVMLGERGDAAAIPFIKQSLTDQEEVVRLAAIEAVVKLENASALPDLLTSMKKGSAAEVSGIKTQLLSIGGDAMNPTIADALPEMPAGAKIALIEVLASRKSTQYINQVYKETTSEDAGVRLAALKALSSLVSEKDLDELYGLLSRVKTQDEIAAVQSALIVAIKTLPKEKQASAVVPVFKSKTGEERKAIYGVLSGIGGVETLKAVVDDFNSGDTVTKNAAFESLVHWTEPNAIVALYNIGIQPENVAFREPALNASIKLIDQSEYTDDQKLLLLRKTMELTDNNKEKSLILNETARCTTYLALKYAAGYLDDPALQQEAAAAVSSIALSNTSLFGEDIKNLLNSILNILEGTESDYQKEAIRKHLAAMPSGTGFVPLFNGKDLTGWKGLVENPIVRSKMKPEELAKAQVKADEVMRNGWKIENGILVFTGNGENLCTTSTYGDFEMIVDWKITEKGDAGIYLRGSPQVQIWDTSRRDAGAQVGSGGLYNNQVYERNPLHVADNPIGEWNTFRIIMLGERVTVYLNGILVVDNIIMENYWDRNIPIFPSEQVELQAHGTWVGYRDIYIREIPRPEPYQVSVQEKAEGYIELFDGLSMFNWTGNTRDYVVEDGCIAVYPKYGGKGNLYTKAEYSDFSFRFEFQLTPGANNGIGIRTPMEGDAAYAGMEIQVLDNTAGIYKNLKEYQYHGSVYGVIPAKREFLKPVGAWNEEEILIQGTRIRVILNGTTIVEGDIAEASRNGTMDHNDHPGLKNQKGHIGFLGHGSNVKFRNLRIKDMAGK